MEELYLEVLADYCQSPVSDENNVKQRSTPEEAYIDIAEYYNATRPRIGSLKIPKVVIQTACHD